MTIFKQLDVFLNNPERLALEGKIDVVDPKPTMTLILKLHPKLTVNQAIFIEHDHLVLNDDVVVKLLPDSDLNPRIDGMVREQLAIEAE